MSEPLALRMPQMNPNDEEAVIVCWHVKSGAWVAAEQILTTVETTKATFDVGAPRAGYVFFDHPPKTMVAVGSVIAWISDEPEPPRGQPPAQSGADEEPGGDDTRFTRKARRLMKEYGLAPADFASAGRVETADVERLARERGPAAKGAGRDDVERLEQSPSKMLEVARLGEAYAHAIPSLVSVAVSCERVERRLQRLAERHGPLSLLEIAVHDVARLLGDFPELNGFYREGQAWAYRRIAVGIAINLGRALRVPVVPDAAGLSPVEVARRVRDLSLRYMRNELTLDDVVGGTFTITDLSGHGVVHFVPVLNDRQSAILGICAERPGGGYRELVLSFDHRMTDGMQAARFLAELRGRLEADTAV